MENGADALVIPYGRDGEVQMVPRSSSMVGDVWNGPPGSGLRWWKMGSVAAMWRWKGGDVAAGDPIPWRGSRDLMENGGQWMLPL